MSMDQLPPVAETESDATSGDGTNDSIPSLNDESGSVSALTILQFLTGQRDAILKVAYSKQATWLALGFVFCAGFFREYDQEDLLHEPWYLLIPVVASTGLACLLHGSMILITNTKTVKRGFTHKFRPFLTCFWMCAPMAAIYAIPVETLLEPVASVKWNITFLLIVSVWRVLLISRILSVLHGLTFWQAFFPVMLLADTLAVGAMTQIRLPIIQVMGGIQLSEAEQIIVEVRNSVLFWGVLSWLIWLGLTMRNLWKRRSSSKEIAVPRVVRSLAAGSTAWGILSICFAGILYGASVMQPMQQRAFHYRQLIVLKDYETAVEYVSAYNEADFPAAWDPPPKLGSYGDQGEFFAMVDAINKGDAPEWFRDRFGTKFLRYRGWGFYSQFFWSDRTDHELRIVSRFLKRDPKWIALLDEGDSVALCDFIKDETDRIASMDSSPSDMDYSAPTIETIEELYHAIPESQRCEVSFTDLKSKHELEDSNDERSPE